MELTGVARRGNVANGADNDKDKGYGSRNANNPVNGVPKDLVGVNVLVYSSKGLVSNKGETDGIKNNIREENNGKADKSASEDFATSGGFGWVARGKHIEVTTVNNKAKHEVSRSDSDSGKDV